MEILSYGIQSQSNKRCILPAPSIPPILLSATGLECLQEKILTVLFQRKGSLFYDRSVGSEIDALVWEDLNDDTLSRIKNTIYDALTTSISDIIIDDIITRTDSNKSIVYVTIVVSSENNNYEINMSIDKTGAIQFEGS